MNFTRLILTVSFCATYTFILAQSMTIKTPNASPKAMVGQQIGLTDVYISYHRPAVKDRKIWGELVAYNTPWRAGANENTVIKFSKEVTIEGQNLPAGKYGFHIIPTEDEWELIFSNNYSSWGSYSYNPAEDALRVKVSPKESTQFEEYLSFRFEGMTQDASTCVLQWGNKEVGFTIQSDVHEAVLTGIRKDLRNKAGWTWIGFYEAANYCANNNINHQEAMGWAQRSIFMNANMQNMMTKAKLTAQLNKAAEAEAKQNAILASLESDLEKHNVTWKEYHGAAKYASKVEAYEKASQWLDQSISMSSNMTNLMDKSKMFQASGKTEKAAMLKAEAIEKGTNQELNLYAYQLAWGGKTAEAIEIFKANCDKHPKDPNTWDSLGEGYYMNGQEKEAEQAFRHCLSMNPPDNVKGNSIKYLTKMGITVDEAVKP